MTHTTCRFGWTCLLGILAMGAAWNVASAQDYPSYTNLIPTRGLVYQYNRETGQWELTENSQALLESDPNAISYNDLYGNNGTGIGLDYDNSSGLFLSGTPLMNFSTPYSEGRNTFVTGYTITDDGYAGALIVNGSELEAAGKSRVIIYDGPPAGAKAMEKPGDTAHHDLLISYGLEFQEAEVALWGGNGGNIIHVGKASGSTYDYAKADDEGNYLNEDGEFESVETRNYGSGFYGSSLTLNNSIMTVSGGTKIVLNPNSSLVVTNHSALIFTDGLVMDDQQLSSIRDYSSDYTFNSTAGSVLAANVDNRITYVTVTDNSVMRLYNNRGSTRYFRELSSSGDDDDDDEGGNGFAQLRINVSGNSSMEMFGSQHLPVTSIGTQPATSSQEINEHTPESQIDRSRLILGKPVTTYEASDRSFYSYASYIDADNPDFYEYLYTVTLRSSGTTEVPDPDNEGETITVENEVYFVHSGLNYENQEVLFDGGLAIRPGASLIGYGSLGQLGTAGDTTEENSSRARALGGERFRDVNGTMRTWFSMGYGSTLMPAVAVLQVGDKTILDGYGNGQDATWWNDLTDYYTHTYGDSYGESGLGVQTVSSIYDTGSNSRYAPASLKIYGNVRMKSGSTLQLVATGNQISTLRVAADVTGSGGMMQFDSGSNITVLGQAFGGSTINVSVDGAVVLIAEKGISYYDTETGTFSTELPSTIFRNNLGTTITGRIVDYEVTEVDEYGVTQTRTYENGALVLSVNQGLSNDTSGLPKGGAASYYDWVSRYLIPPYLNDAALAKSNPNLAHLLQNYASYTAVGGASGDAVNEANRMINPISTTYAQQQASVVEYTVRNAVMDRLSSQRPNSGISAISSLYNDQGTDLSEPPPTDDYYICNYKIWSRALANFSEKDAAYDEPGYKGKLWGVTLGAEQTLDRLTRGVALSYAHSSMERGKHDVQNYDGDLNSVNATLYASLVHGHLFMDGALGYTYNRANERRTLAIPDVTGAGRDQDFEDRLENDYDIHALSASMRFGAMYYMSEYRFMPTVGMDYNYYRRQRSTEKWSDGGDAFHYAAKGYSRFSTPIGLSLSRDFHVDEWRISPEARVSWAHQWIDDAYKVKQSVAGVNTSHQLTGTPAGRNIWSAGLGVTARHSDNLTLVGTYDYRTQEYFDSNNFNFGVDLLF